MSLRVVILYLIHYRRSFYTEEYCVLRSSVAWVYTCNFIDFINVLNDDKLLVFLVWSGNPFHALMPLGKKEYLYAFVLANGIKKVFLSLYLSEGCNRFLLGSISKFEFNALDLLSSKVSKFSDFTIGVTLVRCEYSLVMNLAALFCICSNF